MKRNLLSLFFFIMLFPCSFAGEQHPFTGTYWGNVNCKTCKGLRSKVILNSDGTARVNMISRDGYDDDMLAERGTWSVNKNILIIFTGRDSLFYRCMSHSKLMKLHRDRTCRQKFVEDYMLRRSR